MGEDVLVDLRPHWVFLIAPLAVTAAAAAAAAAVVSEFPNAPVGVAWVLVVMVAVPAAWLATRLASWSASSLVVTDRRLLARRGLVRRWRAETPLEYVTDVRTHQSLAERLVGTGMIVVDLRGTDDPIVLDDVRRPRTLQRVLLRQIDVLTGAADPTGLEITPPHGVPPVLGAGSRPAPPPTARPPVPAPSQAIHEQLIALDDLRRRGILTDDEFQSKKAELLSRL